MKTQVLMERKVLNHIIHQNSHTGYFNLSEFAVVANKYRVQDGLSIKQTERYFDNASTKEFLKQIAYEEETLIEDLCKKKKGKHAGWWVHPLVFVDAAMWFSPEFKVKILRWVTDELITIRNDAGESFKEMTGILSEKFPEVREHPIWYQRIAKMVYTSCGLKKNDPDRWQKASQEQLKKRDKIHNELKLAATLTDNVADCITSVRNINR